MKRRDVGIVLLLLALIPAYYFASRPADKAGDLRDALKDDPVTESSRNGAADGDRMQAPGMPGDTEDGMRDAVRNDSAEGPGAPEGRQPSFESIPDKERQGSKFTPDNSHDDTDDIHESNEVSPSAP